MNRTARALATAALLAVALTACSSGGSDHAKPKASPSAPSKADKFLTSVHSAKLSSWDDAAPTDAELLTFPKEWCSQLSEGHSVDYILGTDATYYPVGQDWGTVRPDANQLLVLGVTAYCPELRSQVTEELRSTGAY